jgi:hypothetical protein
MGLQDLNEELYKRDGEVGRPQRTDAFNPSSASAQDNPSQITFRETQGWTNERQGFVDKHRKTLKTIGVIGGAMAFLALSVVAFVMIRRSAFGDDKVRLTIDGPSEVGGSQLNRFVISYSNTTRADLENAEMTVYYPESFRPEPEGNMLVKSSFAQIHIGTIDDHSQGKVEIPGKFFGSKGSVVYLKAVLKYKPSTTSGEFQSETQKGITVQSSSLALDVEGPLEAASGNKVEYRLDYANTSDTVQTNLRMKLEYPDGFRFESAEPKTSEGDSVWYLGNVAPGQKGTVKVVGTLDGSRNETKKLHAKLGILQGNGDFLAYSETDRLTKIIASPLRIVQTVNGLDRLNVNPGDVLYYAIDYRNEGEIGLRDVIVTLDIQSPVLDFSRIKLLSGAYDSKANSIRWKASDIPQLANLAPGQGGKISFSIPVLQNIPMGAETDKNFTLVSTAKIDSPDVPTPTGANKIVGSDTLSLKVNSAPSVQVKGFYQDARLANTGPMPPKVGAETSYTLHWILSNTTNDLDQVQVTASLPTGVKWLGKTDPSTENISFNQRTNQIVWNVGGVASGTGGLKPAREVAFQVSVVPESAQVGQNVTLLNESTLTAHDLFTDENLQASAGAKTTFMPEDTSLSATAYKVTN